MISINEYATPESVEEAYNLLIKKRNNVVFGGGAFIRMGSKNISTAIDLSKANFNYIVEDENTINIGAMTTLGDIEHSPILKKYFNNVLAKSVREIVGIQLRNIVTVGGTVYSRYGFSDFITGLLALNTNVELYKQGNISLDKFLEEGSRERDILKSISIMKDNRKAAFSSMRNSKGDYAILNVAISNLNGKYRIAVGARPNRAVLANKSMEYLNNNGFSQKNAVEAAKIASEELTFGTNSRGSNIYRKQLCYVLVKNTLMEVQGYED
ncbi:FAD binding domain-containing protein [Tissierella sp. MSJ-40]|uniref:FAD binding domain-containing protein n=1 Tax=Tissierella simiarum TaxID=2841534 RepID=A0ABS6E731_9FIRM|nr:FAD binding domain-containing protein [Tissierella simiarum]MBU5438725.1 FAD binding domain-containing protein [Tissierella simiarum]